MDNYLSKYDLIIKYIINQGTMILNHLWEIFSCGAAVNFFTVIGSLFTIIGVLSAFITYRSWKKNYKAQTSHEYALHLLKEIKELHFLIEDLRCPKFYIRKTIKDDIEKQLIPKIEEILYKKVISIQCDLLVAKNKLLKNNNFQENFNEKILKDIIYKISVAVYSHKRNVSIEDNGVNKELFEIVFPMETDVENSPQIKKSILGTGSEVVNDEFNKVIEANFSEIYKNLEDNLILEKTRN